MYAKKGRVARGLDLARVHLPDPLSGDTERRQEVVFQVVTVGLDGKRSLHAQQPGISFLVSDREPFVRPWNADRSIVLLEESWPTQPATEKVRQFLS